MPRKRRLITAFATLFALGGFLRPGGATELDPPQWVITIKQEKWAGLKGSVLHDGEAVDLPDVLVRLGR
jgi:hypothetical protein